MIACGDVQSSDNDNSNPSIPTEGVRAIVVSEGQYGYSSGSLMSVDYSGELKYNLFSTANGHKLGDIPQYMTQIGDNYYITVNNGNCVEVISSKDYKSVETMVIPYTCVPMFIEDLGNDIIAVTDQTSAAIPGAESMSKIAFLDINHDDEQRDILVGTISMPVPTFEMERVGDKLFVGCEELSVFDIDNLTDEGRRVLTYEDAPIASISKLVLDNRGYMWALTSENLLCIDPATETVVQSVGLGARACRFIDIDSEGKNIYLSEDFQTNSGNWGVKIYRVEASDAQMSAAPLFIHDQQDYWTTYGMQVSPENTIFITRALLGSITRSRVFEYDDNGEIKNYYNDFYGDAQPYFSAGIFSCYIHFLE